MPTARRSSAPPSLPLAEARAIWLHAQRLTENEPFGAGPDAVPKAVAHLGYVQIDTINVIERCHHHILQTRIPAYRRTDLHAAQTDAKTVFEYWTHALSYIAVEDFPFFIGAMKQHRKQPTGWAASVAPRDLRKVLRRIKDDGPLAISDIKDDKLVEKDHPWASKKPSKHALQAAFYNGQVVIARRDGMLKTYELTERHFGWDTAPKPATPTQINHYLIDRALRAQGIISLQSVCYLNAKAKPGIAKAIEQRVRAKELVEISVEGHARDTYWTRPQTLETPTMPATLAHILSPFDPLVIQRARAKAFFGYEHLFEAYLPKEKRKLGYFTLPVLIGDKIVAALDLKTDRQNNELLIQAWHWIDPGDIGHKAVIEAALGRFERFQLGN